MKTVLYMHGGSGNHGCEALVRATTSIIKQYLDSEVWLWSTGKPEDIKYGIDKITDGVLATEEMSHKSISFIVAYIKNMFLKKDSAMNDLFLKKLFKDTVALSIGGDNYCYPWSAKQGAELDRKIRKYCKKNVLWGCSIDEESLTDEVKEDLKGFDLITVREPLSYELIKKINPNTVKVSDPAFVLEKKELPLPKTFIENNTVGINISPLINDYESGENIAYQNYVQLIEYIIQETDMNICLIPHVVWEYNNDFIPINALYEKFESTDRVIKLGDYTCEEIKGYIARCRFFIGARTHATIAAYSTFVPTLVVGYSIKSLGIAQDLFGSYENYVLAVQDMSSKYDLQKAFSYIMENENFIRERLRQIIPKYKESSLAAGMSLKSVVNKEK